MVAVSVASGLNHLQDMKSMRIVILRATAEIHVKVHILADAFVAVKRVKLESFVESNSQTINDAAKHQYHKMQLLHLLVTVLLILTSIAPVRRAFTARKCFPNKGACLAFATTTLVPVHVIACKKRCKKMSSSIYKVCGRIRPACYGCVCRSDLKSRF